jgi:hypothetical protein
VIPDVLGDVVGLVTDAGDIAHNTTSNIFLEAFLKSASDVKVETI